MCISPVEVCKHVDEVLHYSNVIYIGHWNGLSVDFSSLRIDLLRSWNRYIHTSIKNPLKKLLTAAVGDISCWDLVFDLASNPNLRALLIAFAHRVDVWSVMTRRRWRWRRWCGCVCLWISDEEGEGVVGVEHGLLCHAFRTLTVYHWSVMLVVNKNEMGNGTYQHHRYRRCYWQTLWSICPFSKRDCKFKNSIVISMIYT